MSKQTLFGDKARAALLRGVDQVVNPVKVTLGPRGRNVMLDRPGQPMVTRDGVTVAKEVSWLVDPFENMGAAYAREVADAAVTEAGDGTTTSSVLLQAIVKSGIELVADGAEPLHLAEGIQLAANACVETLKAMAIAATPELVEQVAIISTHGDIELGKLIAQTTLKNGEHGVIELQESRDHNTTVEYVDGYFFERGWRQAQGMGQNFINDAGSGKGARCILKNPYILISERIITGAGVPANQNTPPLQGDHLYSILKQCIVERRPLLIVAEDLQGDALQLLAAQIGSGTIPGGCFVKLPGFGDERMAVIKDLQVACGANRIHSMTSTRLDDQLSSFKLEDLGQCDEAIINETRTVLVRGNFHPAVMMDRQAQLVQQIADASNPYEKSLLERRMARLTGGIAVLRVGDYSEPAMIEKKARAEDAIHACRGALQSGVVVGGGLALLRAAQENSFMRGPIDIGGHDWLRDFNGGPYYVGVGASAVDPRKDDTQMVTVRKGSAILLDAMREPISQIIRNAGGTPEMVLRDVDEAVNLNHGFDAAMGQHCDLFAAGIVDPLKVVTVALSKSASIGAQFLTTEVLITDVPEPKVEQPNPAMFRYQ